MFPQQILNHIDPGVSENVLFKARRCWTKDNWYLLSQDCAGILLHVTALCGLSFIMFKYYVLSFRVYTLHYVSGTSVSFSRETHCPCELHFDLGITFY